MTSSHDRPGAVHASQPRLGGLDGLRAVAVAMVLVYHLFPGALPGGFLGVDVFFVISGFLITSLLLREHDLHGRIALGRFWKRRARRLLPALGLVLLVSTSIALLVGGDVLVGIGGQIAGAALFVSNWVFIGTGADYFAKDNPELFRNTWSLSIEEQFYLALPLMLIVLLRFRSRVPRIALFTLLAVASGVWMAVLSMQGAEATRIYFGSDTHVFGLLIGVAAGLCLPRARYSEPGPADPPGLARQTGYTVTAAAGLAVLVVLGLSLRETSPESFQGGFQIGSAAALAVVWAASRPGSWAGRALDARPLQWVGERSYGIYLWHWPLLVLVTAMPAVRGSLPAWAIGIAVLAATVVFAALSYRFIEQPVRTLGLRRSLRTLVAPSRLVTPRRRVVAAALGIVLVTTVPATAYAIVNAPERSDAIDAIERGQAALEAREQEEGGAPGAGNDGDGSGGSGSEGTGGSDDSEGSEGADGADGVTEPVAPTGEDLTAIGDSVMLASLPELESRFPGLDVDAAVSRGLGAGVGLLDERADQGALRGVLVVGLGTNGPIEEADLEALRSIAGTRPIVLVNAHGERDWIPGVNETLERFADAHRGIVVARWDEEVAADPEALAGDGIHPNPSGGEIYADSVQQALDDLQQPDEALGYGVPRR